VFRRDEQQQRLADGFRSGAAEELFRAGIPTADNAHRRRMTPPCVAGVAPSVIAMDNAMPLLHGPDATRLIVSAADGNVFWGHESAGIPARRRPLHNPYSVRMLRIRQPFVNGGKPYLSDTGMPCCGERESAVQTGPNSQPGGFHDGFLRFACHSPGMNKAPNDAAAKQSASQPANAR